MSWDDYVVLTTRPDHASALTTLLDATQTMDRLREHTSRLADERTLVVRYLHDGGMTYRSIGEAIGVSPQAVAKMARRDS